jgi:hypothetical protein
MSAGMGAVGGGGGGAAGGAGAAGIVGAVSGDASSTSASSSAVHHSISQNTNLVSTENNATKSQTDAQEPQADNQADNQVDNQVDLKPVDNINEHSEKLAFTSELFEELEGEGKNPTSIWPPRRT